MQIQLPPDSAKRVIEKWDDKGPDPSAFSLMRGIGPSRPQRVHGRNEKER